MAFGRIGRRREKKKKKRAEKSRKEEQRQQELAAAQDPTKIGEELQQVQEQVTASDTADQPRREEQRIQHQQEAMEDVTTDVPGMSEEQKRAMRESANAQINSQIQNYSRMLASQTGRAGIRGGAAAAPQLELQKQGLQAQNQFQRDLIEKDSDVAMQKLAAYMASLEGKTAEDILRRQQYYDYITGRQDKASQDYWSKYYRDKL